MKSIWKGSINFGMVNIPVKLFPATQQSGLVLSKIRFAEEIRSLEGLRLPPKSLVKPNELKMALTLIGQFSEPFDIKKYKDEYTQSLLQSIRDRTSGKETKVRRIRNGRRMI